MGNTPLKKWVQRAIAKRGAGEHMQCEYICDLTNTSLDWPRGLVATDGTRVHLIKTADSAKVGYTSRYYTRYRFPVWEKFLPQAWGEPTLTLKREALQGLEKLKGWRFVIAGSESYLTRDCLFGEPTVSLDASRIGEAVPPLEKREICVYVQSPKEPVILMPRANRERTHWLALVMPLRGV